MIVKEHFLTYQGTGVLSGVLQYFFRLAGCRQPCPLRKVCDEQGALSSDGDSIDESEILKIAENNGGPGCNWIHITGGEPLEQRNSISILMQMESAFRFQLQTSGLISVDDTAVDFLTVSPKRPAGRLRQTFGDELVVVYDCKWVTDEVMDGFGGLDFSDFFIIPLEESGRFNFVETEAMARRHGARWRLGAQLHKFWGIR